MDGLDLLKAFREVAARESFSRAATALGVRLLNRSTRSVALTDAGQLLLERSKPR